MLFEEYKQDRQNRIEKFETQLKYIDKVEKDEVPHTYSGFMELINNDVVDKSIIEHYILNIFPNVENVNISLSLHYLCATLSFYLGDFLVEVHRCPEYTDSDGKKHKRIEMTVHNRDMSYLPAAEEPKNLQFFKNYCEVLEGTWRKKAELRFKERGLRLYWLWLIAMLTDKKKGKTKEWFIEERDKLEKKYQEDMETRKEVLKKREESWGKFMEEYYPGLKEFSNYICISCSKEEVDFIIVSRRVVVCRLLYEG